MKFTKSLKEDENRFSKLKSLDVDKVRKDKLDKREKEEIAYKNEIESAAKNISSKFSQLNSLVKRDSKTLFDIDFSKLKDGVYNVEEKDGDHSLSLLIDKFKDLEEKSSEKTWATGIDYSINVEDTLITISSSLGILVHTKNDSVRVTIDGDGNIFKDEYIEEEDCDNILLEINNKLDKIDIDTDRYANLVNLAEDSIIEEISSRL